MKTLLSAIALAALLGGCHASTMTPAVAPAAPLKADAPALPRTPYDVARPGETDMEWTPAVRPERKTAPPKSAAKPYFVSKRHRKLFALPTN